MAIIDFHNPIEFLGKNFASLTYRILKDVTITNMLSLVYMDILKIQL